MWPTVDEAVPSWGGILIVYAVTSERLFNFRDWHHLRVGSGGFCPCETLPSCVDEWCVLLATVSTGDSIALRP